MKYKLHNICRIVTILWFSFWVALWVAYHAYHDHYLEGDDDV